MRRIGHAILIISISCGCQSTARKTAYSDNPLVATRQPLVHSAAERERLASAAQSGSKNSLPPPVPLGPDPAAVAQAPIQPPPAPNWDAVPDLSVSRSPEPSPPLLSPLPARTVADELQGPDMPELPVSRPVPASGVGLPPMLPAASHSARVTTGNFGYSTDRTWLQGELDRHYRGHLELRYRTPSDEDTFGGKVRLEDDPRLAEFRAGDIVAVEGEIIRDGDPASSQYPRFRIRSMRLIQRR